MFIGYSVCRTVGAALSTIPPKRNIVPTMMHEGAKRRAGTDRIPNYRFFTIVSFPKGSDSSTALLREPEFCAGFRRYKYGAIASGTSNALPPAQLCVPEQLCGE